MGEKRKIINVAASGNRTRDPSITDQLSVLTNQVHLKIQFRHRFDQVPIHRLVTQTRFSLRSNLVCSTRNNLKIVWTDCTKEFLAFLRQFLHFPSLLLYSWGGFDWSPLCQRASSPISDGDIAFLVGFKKSRVLAFQALRCCCCQNECFLSSHENEKYFDLFHLILSLA